MSTPPAPHGPRSRSSETAASHGRRSRSSEAAAPHGRRGRSSEALPTGRPARNATSGAPSHVVQGGGVEDGPVSARSRATQQGVSTTVRAPRRFSRTAPGPRRTPRRGILLYVSLALVATMSVLATALMFGGRWSEVNSVFIYHSEVITSLAEAAIEEAFFNLEKKINDVEGNNQLYDQLRSHWDPTAESPMFPVPDEEVMQFTAGARNLAKELYGIEGDAFKVKARVTQVQPFNIRGMNPPDPIEKDGALEVAVSITMGDLTKVVVAARPLKVVRTTIPVLSETTLFVNNDAAAPIEPRDNPLLFAHWESAAGYDPSNYPEPSRTLSLDHGWAKYSRTNKKADFIQHLEATVLPEGAVPPGRVFIREGIVPLTNGDRAAGALQKTFYSAESELLPTLPPIPLKDLKENLREGYLEEQARAERARQTREGVTLRNPNDSQGPSTESTGPSDTSSSVPEDGDLIIRYLGSGRELMEDDLKDTLGGNDARGFKLYFGPLVEGPWQQNPPTRSGLDLFGRTTEKEEEKGNAVQDGGFFSRLIQGVRDIGRNLLSKLYAKYDIRISPTIVYGNVLQTYYMARDYAFTGWWEKVRRSFGDKQVPIPYFPKDFLDGKPDETPLGETDLPGNWDEELREKFLKLPEDVRKPSFLKTLDAWATRLNEALGPHMSPSMQEAIQKLPEGTIISPYYLAMMAFLQTDPDSGVDTFISRYRETSGQTQNSPGRGIFFSNVVDRDSDAIQGPYESFYEGPLQDFNPFLFYHKATNYISSLWDPRLPEDAPPEQKNVFLRKFRDKDDEGLLHLDGVIYITGTEDLILKNFRYTGKAILITFGKIVFDGFLVKKEDSADDPKKNDLLTIIALGGIVFNTDEPVHAQLYSYIFPPAVTAGNKMDVFGGLGCNDLLMDKLGDGGRINFDWTYHIPPGELANQSSLDVLPYYHVALTEEIDKFEYLIEREVAEIAPGGVGDQ